MTEEKRGQTEPACCSYGCGESFEGERPDDWGTGEISFVAMTRDAAGTPKELIPTVVTVFWCPRHAAKVAEIQANGEDVRDYIHPTPDGLMNVRLDDDPYEGPDPNLPGEGTA